MAVACHPVTSHLSEAAKVSLGTLRQTSPVKLRRMQSWSPSLMQEACGAGCSREGRRASMLALLGAEPLELPPSRAQQAPRAASAPDRQSESAGAAAADPLGSEPVELEECIGGGLRGMLHLLGAMLGAGRTPDLRDSTLRAAAMPPAGGAQPRACFCIM